MKNKFKNILVIFFLVFVYAIVFILTHGYLNFNIHYTDWCLASPDEDINLNYLNFFAFLNDDSPIPYYANMIYPFKGCLFYIDYSSILSLLIKIYYRYILHSRALIDFQFAWWYGVIFFILQGLFSFKILKKLTNADDINILICSIFFVISPPMFCRFPSSLNLSAHFLILMSFMPFIYKFSNRFLILFWFVSGILSCGIHPYFVPVIFVNLLAYAIYKSIKTKKIIFNISLILIYLSGTFIPYFICSAPSDVSPYAEGLQYYTMNLNSFIHPHSIGSSLFPFLNNLKLFEGNGEGTAYLGGGVILLILFSLFLLFKKYPVKEICSGGGFFYLKNINSNVLF